MKSWSASEFLSVDRCPWNSLNTIVFQSNCPQRVSGSLSLVLFISWICECKRPTGRAIRDCVFVVDTQESLNVHGAKVLDFAFGIE